MFGSSGSPAKDSDQPLQSPGYLSSSSASRNGPEAAEDHESSAGVDSKNRATSQSTRKSVDETDKKRRSSGVSKASALLATAKQSLHLSHSPSSSTSAAETPPTPQQSAMQKLGRTDPALSVPQGSLNNSAGESHPGPHSTFRVGVTEDKNKKCRRTMEDTHAYLYNFLSTPAPVLDMEDSTGRRGEDAGKDVSSKASTASEVIETDNGYFAIFDGHAGTFAADWCGKKLHVLLEDLIRQNPNSAIPELLDQTFTSVDQQLQKLPLKNSGTTAICAVLRWEDRIPNPQSATGSTAIAPVAAAVAKAHGTPDKQSLAPLIPQSIQSLPSSITASTAIPKLQESATRQRVLYTANVGDARIVLCRNGKALRLSYDHKGSDENEGKRITNAGGLILNNRVNGVLAVTRALGDTYMKELITGHPYTTETVIQPDIDEFLILACDGLWDVCADQDAVDLVRNTLDPQIASKQLVDYALSRFSTDNLSCMVVRFDNRAVKQTIEHEVEPIGVEGDPISSKGGLSEAEAIVNEARKSMSIPDGMDIDESINSVSQEIIREEEGKEAGPELNIDESEPDGANRPN